MVVLEKVELARVIDITRDQELAAKALESEYPRANGRWHVTHSIEVAKPLPAPPASTDGAVVRDRAVKDENHSPRPDEDVWFENSLAQDAEISASEVEFFATLRGRMKKS